MSKRNPNKHYSLRKLKTGTASVAVALTVLGTGLANTTDVKADFSTQENPRVTEAREKALEEVITNMSLRRTPAHSSRILPQEQRAGKDNREKGWRGFFPF